MPDRLSVSQRQMQLGGSTPERRGRFEIDADMVPGQ